MSGRDRALSFHWQTEPAALSFLRSSALDPTVRSIVTEAYLVCRDDPDRWISYSRNKNFYKRNRYRSTTYTYASVIRAIGFLEQEGCIEHNKVPQGHLGWQSSFRASPKLMAAIGPAMAVTVELGETIVLRDREDKKGVEYRDNRDTRRMRRQLNEINEALAAARIEHPDLGPIYPGASTKIGGANPGPAQQTLSRIFSGNFNQGGRFYNGFWIGMKGAERVRLIIDGTNVVERDYHALHPTLLYAEAEAAPDGDPYDIPGYPPGLRKLIKIAFNTMVNAGDRRSAAWAVMQRAIALAKVGAIPAGYSSLQTVRALFDAIEKRHQPIAAAFCSDSDVRLQRIDSGMAEHVMLDLSRKGIVALPIHDSFITRAECAPQLDEAMDKALQTALKSPSGPNSPVT